MDRYLTKLIGRTVTTGDAERESRIPAEHARREAERKAAEGSVRKYQKSDRTFFVISGLLSPEMREVLHENMEQLHGELETLALYREHCRRAKRSGSAS